MTSLTLEQQIEQPPTHLDLPFEDGVPVKNTMEHPQSMLLTDSIQPVLRLRYPEGNYFIGQDCGLYWRRADPPQRGCKAPDWFFVPNVPALRDGQARRSYVLWDEGVAPVLVIEFVSDDGSEELDRATGEGKFWVYEQGVRAPFYAVWYPQPARLEMYHLVDGVYIPSEANLRGHYEVPHLGVELGIWRGAYQNLDLAWLRFWDAAGNLLLNGVELGAHERKSAEKERERAERECERAERECERAERECERAERERERADKEVERAENERRRAERLAERLRELGVDPAQV
jgi:Uma2 family endonuclease